MCTEATPHLRWVTGAPFPKSHCYTSYPRTTLKRSQFPPLLKVVPPALVERSGDVLFRFAAADEHPVVPESVGNMTSMVLTPSLHVRNELAWRLTGDPDRPPPRPEGSHR